MAVALATGTLLDQPAGLHNIDGINGHYSAWIRFGDRETMSPRFLCECDFGYGEYADGPFECSYKVLARLKVRLALREGWFYRYLDQTSSTVLDLCASARNEFVGQRCDDELTIADLADILGAPESEISKIVSMLVANKHLANDWHVLREPIAAPSS